MSAEYSPSLMIGVEPYARWFELRPDQLVIEFADGSASEIAASLNQLGMTELASGEAPVHHSLPRFMRWVRIREQAGSLADYARQLLNLQNLPAPIVLASPVYYAAGEGMESAVAPVPGKVLVRLRDDLGPESAVEIAERHGLAYDSHGSGLIAPFHQFLLAPTARRRAVPSHPQGGSNLPPGEPSAAFEAESQLRRLRAVAMAELDWLILVGLPLVPADAHWSSQWSMMTIEMPAAWDLQTGTGTLSIAVIDTGVDLTHPDLQVTPPATHFNGVQAETNSGPYDASPDPSSLLGAHGSLVAGIGAATHNAIGVAGVAGGCSIMPLRIFPGFTSARLAAAINWARANGARVINMSLEMAAGPAVASTAIDNAWGGGIVLCAATGNYYDALEPAAAPVRFPATHARCIAVGATDQNDERKRPASVDGERWGSRYGPEIDVCAPGVRLWSTDIRGTGGWNRNNGGSITWMGVLYASSGDAAGDYFALMGGTSGAAPHVAGLAALLLLRHPGITNQQVRDIIERTCEKVSPTLYTYASGPGRPNGGWNAETGYGRINGQAALSSKPTPIVPLKPCSGRKRR